MAGKAVHHGLSQKSVIYIFNVNPSLLVPTGEETDCPGSKETADDTAGSAAPLGDWKGC